MKARLNFLGGMRKKFGSVIFLTIILSLFSSVNFKLSAAGGVVGSHAVYDSEQTIDATFDNVNFNWYRDGIVLGAEDVTFANPFPIGSRGIYLNGLDLNSNRLTFSSDLYLGDETLIEGPGSLSADGIHCLILNGDVKLSEDNINIASGLRINGGGNILDFNGIGITVEAGQALTLKNIVLRRFTGAAIGMGAGSSLHLENVVIELTGNSSFNTGSLSIRGNVIVKGSGYSFTLGADTAGLTFEADSILHFDVGTTFDVNKNIFAGNATSALHFNGCTVDVVGAGLTVDTGLVLFENKVTIQGANTFDAAAADIRVLSGARVVLDTDAVFKVN